MKRCQTQIQLDSLEEQYYKAIKKIADSVRSQYVIPYCVKHGFSFAGGMGTWAIYDKKGTPIDKDKLPKRLVAALHSETLYGGGQSLGSLIEEDFHSNKV